MKTKRILSAILAVAMVLSTFSIAVFAEEAVVAKIGENEYSTITDALRAAADGDTITLLSDTTVYNEVKSKSLTLDLGGYTLTGMIYFHNGELTITNGILRANPQGYALGIFGSPDVGYAEEDYTVVTIEEDAVIESSDGYGIAVFPTRANTYWPLSYGMTLNVYGTVDAYAPCFVSGNIGYDNYKANIGNVELELPDGISAPSAAMKEYGPVINVYGSIGDEDSVQAIYLPGYVTVNVYEGASITGYEAIGMKGGSVNVYGGTITSTGEKVTPVPAVNSGTEASGAAISVSSYYTNDLFADAANISVNIEGGTINGTNNAAVLVAHSYSNGTPALFKQGVDINISGGNLSGGGEQGTLWIAPKLEGDADTYPTAFVSGGYFATNVNEYCEDGYGITTSDKVGYSYKVAALEANIVETEVKVETPSVNVSDSLPEEVKTAVTESAVKEAETQSAQNTLTDVATIMSNDYDVVGSTAAAVTALGSIAEGNAENITVVVQPYMDIKVVDADLASDTKTITFDIEAKYNLIATVDADNIILDGDNKNAVEMETGKTLDMEGKTIEIALPLPEGFATDTAYVTHIKDNGKTFVYNAEVVGNVAKFTNPHGFSKFTIASTDVATVAKIGDIGYTSLADAIEDAEADDFIAIVKNESLTVTLSDSKTFTVVNNTGSEINVIVNDTEYSIANNERKEITYTKPVVSEPEPEPEPEPDTPSSSGGGTRLLYTVKFEANGGSEVKSISARRSNTIEEPTAPTKEGYAFAGWYKDEELTIGFDFETTVIIADITLYAKWTKNGEEEGSEDASELPQSQFADINAGDWYFDAVQFVTDNKLMNGISASEFAPNALLTRAMLVTILYRNEGEPEVAENTEFTDIEEDFYYVNPVIWAKANGIVNGVTDTKFAPDDNITREQIAAIIYRYAQYKGMDAVNMAENLSSFADSDEISEYAVSALNWAVGCGLINGRTSSTLNPQDNATRAEIATILQRFLKIN